ncbi:hypothetical protein L195_g042487, partial [Trifolium pratense]
MKHHRVSALFFSSLCSFILVQGLSQHSVHLDTHWYPGTATWYGEAEGDGST